MTGHYTLGKGGLFSYIGELRIPVNRVPLVDYTDWGIGGRIEGKNGVALPNSVLVVEWVDITQGLFRFRIPVSEHGEFQEGIPYMIYLVLTTPAGDDLPPITLTLAAVEN